MVKSLVEIKRKNFLSVPNLATCPLDKRVGITYSFKRRCTRHFMKTVLSNHENAIIKDNLSSPSNAAYQFLQKVKTFCCFLCPDIGLNYFYFLVLIKRYFSKHQWRYKNEWCWPSFPFYLPSDGKAWQSGRPGQLGAS